MERKNLDTHKTQESQGSRYILIERIRAVQREFQRNLSKSSVLRRKNGCLCCLCRDLQRHLALDSERLPQVRCLKKDVSRFGAFRSER